MTVYWYSTCPFTRSLANICTVTAFGSLSAAQKKRSDEENNSIISPLLNNQNLVGVSDRVKCFVSSFIKSMSKPNLAVGIVREIVPGHSN